MDLDEIRTQIDLIDAELREQLLARLECSERVAAAKHEAGSVQVWRPEREAEMAERLAADVPAEQRDEYLASLRAIVRASRMRQYRLLLEWRPELFDEIPGGSLAQRHSERVRVLMGIRDEAGSLARALITIADAGYDVADLNSIGSNDATIDFELVIWGDALEPALRAALLQLAAETQSFRIVGIA